MFEKFINPAPEILAIFALPLFRRTEIWTEKRFNPYKCETNEDDFGFESLGKLVTPVFQDEIDHEEICDPMSGQYGINVLKRTEPVNLKEFRVKFFFVSIIETSTPSWSINPKSKTKTPSTTSFCSSWPLEE